VPWCTDSKLIKQCLYMKLPMASLFAPHLGVLISDMTDSTARPHAAEPSTAEQLAEVKRCRDIINFQVDGEPYGNKQAARAIPNRRLKTMFGIENGFTTDDTQCQRDFRKNAIAVMNATSKTSARSKDGDWTDLRDRAIIHCQEYLESRKDSHTLDLPGLVQFITLKLSLYYLFPGKLQQSRDTFDDIVFIGHRINQLWIESKQAGVNGPKWKEESKLQHALRRVLTAHAYSWASTRFMYSYYDTVSEYIRSTRLWKAVWGSDNVISGQSTLLLDPSVPEHNPMNLILPAYETMWRVVMRCFLEIRYRDAENGDMWSQTMVRFLEDLRDLGIMSHKPLWRSWPEEVKAVDIVKKALRLYPPTRRVHREFDGKSARADIEACHRLEILAGEDAHVFRPERWQDIGREWRDGMNSVEEDLAKQAKNTLRKEEEKLGFLPFAIWCPAGGGETKGFGIKMIALLVATLCDSIGPEWELEEGEPLPRREDAALSAVRTSYETLGLKRS